MFRYIVKRLLLFIPTLILVSCLCFFLSKQVPADQVDMILHIQGIDDSNESYIKEYNSLYRKMNLHLPEFYFSVRPNYLFETRGTDYNNFEQKFISRISSQKYSKSYITSLIQLINQTSEQTRKKLFYSTDLNHLKEKILSFEDQFSIDLKSSMIQLIDNQESHKVKWHYPILRFNGLQNQYHKWLYNIFRGDFGVSLVDTRPVTEKLWDSLRWSIVLLLLTLFFVILFSFPIGLYNGMRPNSTFDNISNGFLFAFFAVPKFWLATLMIIFFTTSEYGAWTNIFPSVGIWYSSGDQGFLSMLSNSWNKLILPVLMLVIPDVAYLARLIRSNVQEESSKEYVKTAISKGMSLRDLTIKHVMPNSLIPSITLLLGSLPAALASTLVIEVIFNIPGVGMLMFDSIENADWAMVYPIVLIISVLAVIIFLVGDILMAFLNPKIKLG